MTENLGNLLTNSAILRDFIDGRSPVVDKTIIIQKLLSEPTGSYLLCRPRRFGKTMLLDTIANIFCGERELFKDMRIGQESQGYDWKVFPVIRLDLSGTSSEPKMINEILAGKVEEVANYHKVNIHTGSSSLAILRLINAVSNKHIQMSKKKNIKINRQYPRNVVLLIDEYDFALQDKILDFKKSKRIRAVLHDFSAVIKSCDAKIRFCLITGITRFEQLSLSPGMNAVEDITYNSRYSAICGFTKEEIELTFCDYLDVMLRKMKDRGYFDVDATKAELLSRINDWYDGYTWDGHTKVLNPYSVTKCLKNFRFSDYWSKSGPSMMLEQLGLKSQNYFRIFRDDISVENDVSIGDSDSIYNDNAVLLQSGYLTIASIDHDLEQYSLKMPNYEIYNSVSKSLLAKSTLRSDMDGITGLGNPKYQQFYDAFCSRNQSDSEMLFSSFISDASYFYDINEEYMFSAMLSLCLDIGKSKRMREVPTRKGRTDIVMPTPIGEWLIVDIRVDRSREPVKSRSSKSGGEFRKDKSSGERESGSVSVKASLGASPNVAPSLNGSEDSPVIAIGELTETAVKSLDESVRKAFRQIVARQYAQPYLGRGKDVYAVAVAIYDSSCVRIRFRRVVWKDRAKGTVRFQE
ncbi:MAG: AAA family ATPase [Deltaproteobacteria bacterium]|jgi:hypothetical protein|nr:AAA family ATPase [Deltaproteobacteria bacterium]